MNTPFFADKPYTWTIGKSSAYPNNGPTNVNDAKLDYIASYNMPSSTGLFHATKMVSGFWNTDLATTEYSTKGFKLTTNNSLAAIVTLPKASDMGAWPAIWTWGSGSLPGHGEIDLFEWHNDNPYMLELSNHVTGDSAYIDNIVQPGVPFDLQVDFSSNAVTWYVNGFKVFATKGLPLNWSAYIIVNLSVSNGKWHPAPTTNTTMAFRVNGLRVW